MSAVLKWNAVSQALVTFLAVVANYESQDLTCSATDYCPKPALIDFAEHEAPYFVVFQNVIRSNGE